MVCKILKSLKLEIIRKIVATGICALFVLGSLPISAQEGLLSGDAESEARRPYENYSVDCRDTETGVVVATFDLDPANAEFECTGLSAGSFIVELVDYGSPERTDDGDIVCTEGPFDLEADSMSETGINIGCNSPVAWWWLAGIVAGLTTGLVVTGQESPVVSESNGN